MDHWHAESLLIRIISIFQQGLYYFSYFGAAPQCDWPDRVPVYMRAPPSQPPPRSKGQPCLVYYTKRGKEGGHPKPLFILTYWLQPPLCMHAFLPSIRFSSSSLRPPSLTSQRCTVSPLSLHWPGTSAIFNPLHLLAACFEWVSVTRRVINLQTGSILSTFRTNLVGPPLNQSKEPSL